MQYQQLDNTFWRDDLGRTLRRRPRRQPRCVSSVSPGYDQPRRPPTCCMPRPGTAAAGCRQGSDRK
ncbi:MAG: hypothetical protein V3R80_13305, partial [Candidatus Tectomicrobia bacterium]